jgi:hypothetical protein
MFSSRTDRPLSGLTSTPGSPHRSGNALERSLVALPAREDGDDGLQPAPWRALCPRRVLELRDPDLASLRQLPSGTAVAIVTDGPLARWRMQRRARLAGVRLERQLIVLPSTSTPIVVLDDAPSAVRHFWDHVAAVPPGVTRGHGPASLALAAARRLPWRVTGMVAPGRVMVGWRA